MGYNFLGKCYVPAHVQLLVKLKSSATVVTPHQISSFFKSLNYAKSGSSRNNTVLNVFQFICSIQLNVKLFPSLYWLFVKLYHRPSNFEFYCWCVN